MTDFVKTEVASHDVCKNDSLYIIVEYILFRNILVRDFTYSKLGVYRLKRRCETICF